MAASSTGTWYVYASCPAKMANKEIDWDTDTIKVMLCTVSYVPNQATHDYKSDVTNEITGPGYTAGGQALASKTITLSTLEQRFDAADVVWTSSTFTARVAVIYVDTGNAATSALIAFMILADDVESATGTWTLEFPATGIFASDPAAAP